MIDGFAVQPMRSRHGAYELMIGVRTGRRFGPVIFFGGSALEAEVIDDVAYALPPLNMQAGARSDVAYPPEPAHQHQSRPTGRYGRRYPDPDQGFADGD